MEQAGAVNGSHDDDDAYNNNDKNVTIKALRKATLDKISALLNPRKIILSDEGFPRDWQGLAHLCGVGGEQIPGLSENDQTNKILRLWYQNDAVNSTIDNFLVMLEKLDRFDIIDDITPLINDDVKAYKNNSNRSVERPVCDLIDDSEILTGDDVKLIMEGLPPQKYDALVLYADEDVDFATDLIHTMEERYKDLKFCVIQDLVGGRIVHKSVIKLISERCYRLVLIITPEFFKSAANDFYAQYAQFIGIEQESRKIIPCLYKPCPAMPNWSLYVMLDYTRSGKLYNFWKKLYESLKVARTMPKSPTAITSSISESNHCIQEALKPTIHHEKDDKSIKSNGQAVKFNTIHHEKEDKSIKSNGQAVKFNTLDETDSQKVHEKPDNDLSASTSDSNNKKSKANLKLLKKLLLKGESKKDNTIKAVDDVKRKKKAFWPFKKKVAVVAN